MYDPSTFPLITRALFGRNPRKHALQPSFENEKSEFILNLSKNELKTMIQSNASEKKLSDYLMQDTFVKNMSVSKIVYLSLKGFQISV